MFKVILLSLLLIAEVKAEQVHLEMLEVYIDKNFNKYRKELTQEQKEHLIQDVKQKTRIKELIWLNETNLTSKCQSG